MAITVTTTADELNGILDGEISLREAIAAASDGETIDFAVTGMISLDSELTIDKSLTINGPGASLLTVQAFRATPDAAGDGARILTIDDQTLSTKDVTIRGLRLADGDMVGDGGAILNRENLTIENCTITGNLSQDGAGGGAIFNASGDLTVVSSLISGNRTTGSGGAIFNDSGNVAIEHSLIRSNVAFAANGRGGAIQSLAGDVTASYSTIAFNSADYGGGISLQGGSLVATNCTISGNEAKVDGGGVHLRILAGEEARFAHATIAKNRADSNSDNSGDGGGIFVDLAGSGIPNLIHTIVAGNEKRTSGPQSSDLVGPSTGSYSLVNVDAMLAPLSYNGGNVPTHALLPGSPAIDAGDSNAVAGAAAIPFHDARGMGFTRVFDGGGTPGAQIDIGAFELQSPGTSLFLVVDSLLDESDGNYSTGDLSLREAILLTNQNHGTPDTITFAPSLSGGVIQLTMGELTVTDDLTITGLGAKLLTIDASFGDPTPLADDGDGSRIFSIDDGNPSVDRTVTISGLRLVGGDTFAGGGAIRNSEDLTLSECEVSGNSAKADGGGILSFDGKLTVVDSIITGNSTHKDYATYGGGGGIATFSYLKLVSSAVFGNVSAGHGGGILAGDGQLRISNSTISGNTAGTEDSPHREGGGIFIGKDVSDDSADVEIVHSTITGNSAPIIAGIFVDSSLFAKSFVVDHSIVAGNLGIDTNEIGLVFSFSLVNVDPKLAPLGDHGGLTPTHAPLANSPAIDAGNPLPNVGVFPAYDQRGNPFSRMYSAVGTPRIDIGAHEAQPPPQLGDANGDFRVDAADYTVWRDMLGQIVGAYTLGDLNGDGSVTPNDYGIWKGHFGQSFPGSGAGIASFAVAGPVVAESVVAEPIAVESRIEAASNLAELIVWNSEAAEFPKGEFTNFSTLVTQVDHSVPLRDNIPEKNAREAQARDQRGRRWRNEPAAPQSRDLLLATIGSVDRRANRIWEFAADFRCANEVTDLAIESLEQEADTPNVFGTKYRLRL